MTRPALHSTGLAILLLFFADIARAEWSYWVWERRSAPGPDEVALLQEQGVERLYWRSGELENHDGTWTWIVRRPLPELSEDLELIPVLRLEPTAREPFNETAVEGLTAEVRNTGFNKVQLDYDCPDRLLSSYAAALERIRREVTWLSVTALAGWVHHPDLAKIGLHVDEIVPMFYDLELDPVQDPDDPAPLPLIEHSRLAPQLRAWNGCGIPWRAGLPSFSRVTVFDAEGRTLGHIRNWRWEEIVFNSALGNLRPAELGVTLLEVLEPARIAGSMVKPGQWLAVRWADQDELAAALETVAATDAMGVVLFRLPDRGHPSGWSLQHLSHLNEATLPALTVTRGADQRFGVTNHSGRDLPPRLGGPEGPWDRGYALELVADGTVFREAFPGDFWQVTGYADHDGETVRVRVQLATRLRFWFSHLPVGGELITGLIQIAPGVSARDIESRVLYLEEPWTETAEP